MPVALDASIVISLSEHFVDVETESELTRGMTVVDRLNVADNERVAMSGPHISPQDTERRSSGPSTTSVGNKLSTPR